VAQATYAQDTRQLLHFRRTLVSFRLRFWAKGWLGPAARSQDAAALAAITKADSVGWRLYEKTPRKIGFAPSVKSACSERSRIVGKNECFSLRPMLS
jgi:hypothetical protein